MTVLNYFCLSTLLICVPVGAWRGWVSQALTMLGLLIAVLSTMNFGPVLAMQLPLSGPGESFRNDLGVLVVLVVTVYLGHLISTIHAHIFVARGKEPAHRVLGGFMGLVSGFLLLMAVFLMIDVTELRNTTWWSGSLESNVFNALMSHLKQITQ
jgi:membrane protein required for colicin V production